MKGKNNLLNEDEERCYQHFWRSFKPRDRREVDKLCAKLGRKIFAIEESTGTLHYSHRYVQPQNMLHFLNGINTCHLSNILLPHNTIPSLLQTLSKIYFSNLIVLQLTANNISTLEPLQQMQTQYLEILILDDNRLTSIRPLAKCDLSSLITLSFNKNCVSEIGQILTLINAEGLESVEARENRCRSEGLTFIAKNISKQLRNIDLSFSRICLPKTRTIKSAILQMHTKFESYIFS